MIHFPKKQGLYDPAQEKDSCGVGFVAQIKGVQSHEIVLQGLELLVNLDHRGATGADPNVGDGAGILLQIPHDYLSAAVQTLGFSLPDRECYGVAMVFLPQEESNRAICESIINDKILSEGQKLLGWRTVRVDNSSLGKVSRDTQPYIRQVFVERASGMDLKSFERKLYIIRRLSEKSIKEAGIDEFSISSASARTIVYKGMLTAGQVGLFYPDLHDESIVSAIALVHARYSTNTFPSWELAQPFHRMAHNGEINTLRGNQNWMQARENNLTSQAYGDELEKVFPVTTNGKSDSAIFDEALEFIMHGGRSISHVMTMMIPEVWDNLPDMDPDLRAYYQYHATLMEPWDGPAAIAFTDGEVIGATLDRNGLRPARIIVTADDRVIMASEAGVLPVKPEDVVYKTRLQPGRIFEVDTKTGQIIANDDLKKQLASGHPYKNWVDQHTIELHHLPEPPSVQQPDHDTVLLRQQIFGYTKEDLKYILRPMSETGAEPIGSMGNDVPLAVLSNKSKLLFNYFKQNFAQVTNPAIDPLREELVMSLTTFLGREGNLLDADPVNAHVLRLSHPILSNYELEKLRHVTVGDFQAKTLPVLFRVTGGIEGMKRALNTLLKRAEDAVNEGYSLIILTDRGVDHDHAAIPSLLATSAVHHHLIRAGSRANVGLIVETGEAREVQHFALLVGYGATAINPYLAFETLVDRETLFRKDADGVVPPPVANYIKAVGKGLLKVLSKMGISTLQSYHGAQIFECLGLNEEVINQYFTGTSSKIGGISLDEIATEVLMRHNNAYPYGDERNPFLDLGGVYQFRREGEYHLVNPTTVTVLQKAVREESPVAYQEYADAVNTQNQRLGTIRGLLEFKSNPIPIEEVEPASEIVKRFATGAMSLGSISQIAHETLAKAMNQLGGKSNTGEGGEDPTRFEDDRNSAIKQVASGRFGVNSHYLVNARELQIKISQGAKPGEGGQLPGHKVDKYIGSVRFTTPGVALISPPPHHDIYSIEDIKQLIFDLKNANPDADVSVKLVAETGVGTVAAGVAKAKADMVLISGYDGGTGASPLSSIQHAGTPWELGLAETQQTLVLNNLRGRIRVQTDGKLQTGRDLVIAALLGAEEFGFATMPLVAMGCIMMRVCHLNTCPVGIATQNKELIQRFKGQPEHVVRFLIYVAEEARRYMAELGFRTMDEMIGRVDRLEPRKAITHWKAKGLDFSRLLYRPSDDPSVPLHCVEKQDKGLSDVLDHILIEKSKAALESGEKVAFELPIKNSNLTTGTMLGSKVSKRYGGEGLPDDTISITFNGTSGQSFGAFVPKGITMTLLGDANDFTGKGLSGGKLIVRPPEKSKFPPEENIIIGNVSLYGATSGKAFFNGQAGERFCVRNSGVNTVVEGVGDHGCEYMTGGRVVVLGRTGLNFAAGMSGGVAYVFDEDGGFSRRCNMGMVELESLEADDLEFLREILTEHVSLTGSPKGKRILENWAADKNTFIKIMPVDYKRVLAEQKQAAQRDIA